MLELQEIMESKLPLICSNSIQYDPLVNVDYTESFTRNIDRNNSTSSETETTGNNSSTSSSSGLNVNSDTPQGEITKANILAGNYATSTGASESEVEDSTESSTSGTASSTGNEATEETYSKNVKGNSGVSATAQKMIEQYRENIISIDRDIIKDLNILFMGLY